MAGPGYNGLVDVGYGKHLRVDHSKDEFAKGLNHSNGIEGFWGYAKTRLFRFRGMAPSSFSLHLKESDLPEAMMPQEGLDESKGDTMEDFR